MPKITIIGSGSDTWGTTFLRDIFVTPELRGSTIVLHDIIQDRVDLVFALWKKMIADFQLGFHLEQTLSLEQSYPNGGHFTGRAHNPCTSSPESTTCDQDVDNHYPTITCRT